jgi:hypothetical protein
MKSAALFKLAHYPAVRRLAFERNEEYKYRDRQSPNDILNGAGEACLLLLTSGARVFWRPKCPSGK